MNLRKLFAFIALSAAAALPLRADVLTFDEDYFGDVIHPDDPLTTYTLPSGVQLTFQNLNYWWPQGGPFPDAGIAYGSGGKAVISFSQSVYVPSIWVGASNDGNFSDDGIAGFLGGTQKFGVGSPLTELGDNSWREVTAGAGVAIDRLELGGDFTEGWVGQIEINAIPEPATMTLALLGGTVLALRRKK